MENKQLGQAPPGTDREAVQTDVVNIAEQEAPNEMEPKSL